MTARAAIERSAGETAFRFARAAIGAGAPAGIAEALGRVAVALRARGPAPEAAIAPALAAFHADPASGRLEAVAVGGALTLKARDGGPVSVLFAGPAVIDWLRGGWPEASSRLRVRRPDVPALLQAYPAGFAGPLPPWQAVGDGEDLLFRRDAAVTTVPAETPAMPASAADAGADAVIQRFFQTSLVPASAESRAQGAGAGLVDRD